MQVMVKRNPTQGVQNLWINRDGQRTKLYGKGKQYRAYYVDTAGETHTRRFEYKSEASDWLREQVQRGNDIAPPVRGQWTVRDQYGKWIRAAHIAETTRATRRITWATHVEEKWGDRQITKVETPAIKEWIADLKEDPKVGVPTIENALGVLRMILTDAVEDGRLIRNPCDGIKSPRRQSKRRNYLDHEQVEMLATAVGSDAAVVWTLAYCGLRFGELSALAVASVDRKKRRLEIVRSVSEVEGRLVWKDTPKDHERRSVPYPAFLDDHLAKLIAGKGREDLLFQSPDGGVLRLSTWRNRVFNKARTKVIAESPDFPQITPNDLRHTAASLTVSAGGNVLALARMLGHESPRLTLETYADLFDSDLDALAEVLDARRAAALSPAGSDGDSVGECVPGTQKAHA
jgi:integrase